MTNQELIQKIRKEIERRIEAYNKNFKKADNTIARINTDARRQSLIDLCHFLDNLVPSEIIGHLEGLDEAAEKSGLEYAPIISGEALDSSGQCYETDDVNWPSRCGFMQGFKAGAEWMAGQGVSIDGKVIMDFSEPADIINRRLIAKLGDSLLEIEPGKVVVQIRKK